MESIREQNNVDSRYCARLPQHWMKISIFQNLGIYTLIPCQMNGHIKPFQHVGGQSRTLFYLNKCNIYTIKLKGQTNLNIYHSSLKIDLCRFFLNLKSPLAFSSLFVHAKQEKKAWAQNKIRVIFLRGPRQNRSNHL